MDWFKEFPQTEFLDLIASGKTEQQALDAINIGRVEKHYFKETNLVMIQVKSPKFREDLEEAKKRRADVWFGGIVQSVNKVIDKEEVPAEKLKFEQRKYLAAIDNPEKYSEKQRLQMDVGINIFQEMKDLKSSDVQKLLKEADPFVVAEFENITPASGQGPDEEEEKEEDIFSWKTFTHLQAAHRG